MITLFTIMMIMHPTLLSIDLRDDEEKTLLETLWKESKILLLQKNGEPHLDDDGEPVNIIKRGPRDNDYGDLLTHTRVDDKSDHAVLNKSARQQSKMFRIVLQEENPQHISQIPDNDPDWFFLNYETGFDPTFNPRYDPSNYPSSDPYPNQSLPSDWFPGAQVNQPHYHKLKAVVMLRNVV